VLPRGNRTEGTKHAGNKNEKLTPPIMVRKRKIKKVWGRGEIISVKNRGRKKIGKPNMPKATEVLGGTQTDTAEGEVVRVRNCINLMWGADRGKIFVGISP